MAITHIKYLKKLVYVVYSPARLCGIGIILNKNIFAKAQLQVGQKLLLKKIISIILFLCYNVRYRSRGLAMLKTAVPYLKEIQVGGRKYMSIEKPYATNVSDDITVIADSIVQYWDNIATKYGSSEGCLVPIKYISDLLHKSLNDKPKVNDSHFVYVRDFFEMVSYLAIFFVGIMVVLGLSSKVIIEHRRAVSSLPLRPSRYEFEYSRVISEENITTDGEYNEYNNLLGTPANVTLQKIVQNISTYLVGELPTLRYSLEHTHFGIACLIAFAIVFILAITSGLVSKFRRGCELKNVSMKKYRTLIHIQRLIESLKEAVDYKEQDKMLCKDEIFSRKNVIFALRIVKKDGLNEKIAKMNEALP